jgi:hypothetical protein
VKKTAGTVLDSSKFFFLGFKKPSDLDGWNSWARKLYSSVQRVPSFGTKVEMFLHFQHGLRTVDLELCYGSTDLTTGFKIYFKVNYVYFKVFQAAICLSIDASGAREDFIGVIERQSAEQHAFSQRSASGGLPGRSAGCEFPCLKAL